MKIARTPHRWSVKPRRAREIQQRLAAGVRQEGVLLNARWIAGTDLAFTPDGRQCIAGVVLWDVEGQRVAERHVRRRPVSFPYVPGLLSFRECPALLAVLRGLRRAPDAVITDGHGFAHPRRFGLASHVGVLLDLPVVGCAKSLLVGEYVEPGAGRGDFSALRENGEVIGAVLRTREKVRPVFVSVGHKLCLDAAVRLVLACGDGYRLPAPTRLADALVSDRRRSLCGRDS